MSTHSHTVTLIPGDGIGPEVTDAAVRVAEAAGATIQWERVEAGAEVVAKYGSPVPDHVLNSVRTNRVALKGPITTPIGEGFQSANVFLRKALDLYASVRPVKSVPGVESPFRDVNLIVVRENTEGLYSGLEHRIAPGIVEGLKIVTERACTRISRFAFELAERTGRKKIHVIHKANIMKLADGLFLECSRKVARDYPEIEYQEMIIDNCAMQLVKDPRQFDLLLLENLYGDIISDLCAGLVGGLGVVPGANIGERTAVFEAVHGTAPDIAGKGLANPTALMMSAVMMLAWLGLPEASRRFEKALLRVYSEGRVRTGDLGGSATTKDFTDAVIAGL